MSLFCECIFEKVGSGGFVYFGGYKCIIDS